MSEPSRVELCETQDRRPPAMLLNFFDAARRAWRVALAWVGVLTVFGLGGGVVAALWRSALSGLPMPDLTAGLAPMAIAIAPLALEQINRHIERRAGVV